MKTKTQQKNTHRIRIDGKKTEINIQKRKGKEEEKKED